VIDFQKKLVFIWQTKSSNEKLKQVNLTNKTKPELVSCYNILPGNGPALFTLKTAATFGVYPTEDTFSTCKQQPMHGHVF